MKTVRNFIDRPLVRFIILSSIALFATFFLNQNPIQGSSSPPFYWDLIHVEIQVQENGDMLVRETQKYVFTAPYSNQRYRYIPLDKVDEITDVEVLENGKTIPVETGSENNQFWIKWQHKLNPPEAHTFVLKYRVIGGLHIYNEGDLVYWKAIFADRKAAVQKADVIVILPDSLAGKTL